jgi:polyphosphate kinase
MFPVEDARLKARIMEEILPIVLADNVKARRLLADGSYVRPEPSDGHPVRSQLVFQNLAREAAREVSDPTRQFVPILRRPAARRVDGEPGEIVLPDSL